jgi:hypothetical protein
MSTCTANITKNRNRSKIYQDSVYLKDGENFEIELFNPTTSRVLAKITINGNSISNSGIVLKPGERIYLERFIDSNNKFVFETYQVEGSKESLNAIRNNGFIEVSFYSEIVIPTSYPNPYYTYSEYNSFNTNFGIIGNVGTDILGGSTYCTGSSGISFGGNTQNNIFTATNMTTNSLGCNSNRSKSIETGRIEKGDSSNQLFKNVNGNFNSFPSSSVLIKLLPESQKPIESSSLRSYCTNCGTRMKKQTWKFCPNCGTKI